MYNIIIANSSLKTAELIMNCLDNRSYNLMTSETGSNVLAKCRLFNPDLVISSADLADMSGYDLCKTIKRTTQTADCLVLLISSGETNETSLKAVQAGADDFMDNTFDSLLLQAKVKSLLRVKSLSDQLKDKYSELEEKNKVLDMQLEIGRQVQSSLIQKPDLYIGELKITNKYMPAIAIGGDFYDVIPIDEDKVAIIIGDVSGHGISSALLTSMLIIMTRNLSDYYRTPDELLYFLNNQFIEAFGDGNTDIYTCVFAAFIDTKKNTMVYSNAGLTPPIHTDYESKSARELSISGVPIGMMKGSEYESKTLVFNKHDLVVFHTDGLSDTFFKDDPKQFVSLLTSLMVSALGVSNRNRIIDMLIDEFCNKNASEAEKWGMDDVSIILCQM